MKMTKKLKALLSVFMVHIVWFRVYGIGVAGDGYHKSIDDSHQYSVSILHFKIYLAIVMIVVRLPIWVSEWKYKEYFNQIKKDEIND